MRPARSLPLLAVTLLLSAGLLATHLILPLNIDNDLYQAMGWALAGRGLLPLVGSWAHTLPGMPYLHAVSILIFGNSALGFRVFDVLVHLGSALIMFTLAERYLGSLAGSVAATALTLYYVSEGFWLAGQPDGFAIFFILLGTWLYLRSVSLRSFFFSGLALSCAGLIRPTYFLFAASLFAIALFSRRRVAPFVLGSASALALLVVPYLFVPNGLYELYEAAIGFNLSVYGSVRTSYDLFNLIRHPIVIAALLGVALWAFHLIRQMTRGTDPRISEGALLLVCYAVSGFALLYVMGKFLVYHFDPIFAIAAYLTGYAVFAVDRTLRPRWISIALLGIVSVVGFRMLYPFNLLHIAKAAVKSEHPFLAYCYGAIKDGTDFGYDRESELVRYVQTRHPVSIEFASITPALLWRSEVPQATRFTMIHAIAMREKGHDYTEYQRQCQAEYLQQLSNGKPSLYILSREPHNLAMFGDLGPETIVRSLPGIDSLIRVNYVLDTSIGPFDCYRRGALHYLTQP